MPNRGDENCETVLLYPLSYSPEVFPISHRRKVELVGLEPTTCSSDSIRHRFKATATKGRETTELSLARRELPRTPGPM